jgi:hypothetical protein
VSPPAFSAARNFESARIWYSDAAQVDGPLQLASE